MESLLGLSASLAGLVAEVPLPAWVQDLDWANRLIGGLVMIFGLLGLAYLVFVFVSTPEPVTEPVEPEAYPVSDRFLVPLLLPIGVALAVISVIALISQILLVVPEAIATPIALAIALFILVACAVIANKPKLPTPLVYTALCGPLALLVLVGSGAAIYRFTQAQAAAAAEALAEANAVQTALTENTTDNVFSKKTFNVPVGHSVTLTQNNKGLNQHNWHVLDVKSTDGNDIATQVTAPGATSTVTFTIATPGTYKFVCDVHPTEMIGQITVKASS